MPPSLQTGPSAIVPIKAPAALREQLRDLLRDGETLSDLTRQLWTDEIRKRTRAAKRAAKQEPFNICPRCNLPCGGGCG